MNAFSWNENYYNIDLKIAASYPASFNPVPVYFDSQPVLLDKSNSQFRSDNSGN